ncbi:MAG: DUF1294 domain-containing protein [Rubrivivax sp.]|nr:MAG: DUF1294 domain-containing protein [Rubrivivax sp.]
MHKSGHVVRWNEERGFGFIRSADSHADVFFHTRDFRGPVELRPREGLPVDFEEIHVGGKGPRAMAVRPGAQARPQGPPPAVARKPADGLALEPMQRPRKAPAARARGHAQGRNPPRTAIQPARGATRRNVAAPDSHAALMLPLIVAYAAVIAWALWTRRLPLWLLAALPAVNLVTFGVYWHDKYAASKNQWRIAENTLHAWSLAGGWPSAWLAQQVLRHKSSKASFQSGYFASVVLHWGLLGAWLWWRGGMSFQP